MSKTRYQRPYLIMLAISVLFFGPLIAAWSFYYSGYHWGDETLNHGYLIRPTLSFEKLNLQNTQGHAINNKKLAGKWILFYISPHDCDSRCQTNLYNMRQVRLAVGENMQRVERVVATFPQQPASKLAEAIKKEYRGTQQVVINKQQFMQLIAKLPSARHVLQEGYLYLIDPHGNMMMSYKPTAATKGLFKDLQRLLKISQIG